MKKRKKKNVTEDENYKDEMFIQQTQSSHDCNAYDINNKLIKLILSNKIIKRKKTFHS